MSDRVAVMSNSRIAQLGTPAEIYECPRTPFVARFIGESSFFEGRAVDSVSGGWIVEGPDARFVAPHHDAIHEGSAVRVAVRPEWLELAARGPAPEGFNAVDGTIREIIYLGETLHVLVRIGARDVPVAVRNEGQLTNPLRWKRGEDVAIRWRPQDCQVLEDDP